MEYRNFDLWIETAATEGYPLRAASETQGGAKGRMLLDPLSEPLQGYLDRLAAWETDEDFLIELGMFLYNALFIEEIESLFQLSLGEVMGQEARGLRVRLHIAPPELSALPWEYLYLPGQRYFLGTSKKTPLVRCPWILQPIRALKTILPLKVLVAIPDGSRLDAEKEKSLLTEALSKLGNTVQPRFLEGSVTRSTIADALLEEQYHIFHFVGHGIFEDDRGHLLFNDSAGGDDPINEVIFARFFLDEPSIKLVILNACEGARVSSSKPMVGMASKLIERGIPAVIAHQFPVMDKAAVRFAREFYRGLCVGANAGRVDAAMAYARNQLSIHFPTERSLGAPVLFMRAPDGLIFDVGKADATSSPPPGKERQELTSEQRDRLQNLLRMHERNRRVLEEQIAEMGTFAPAYLRAQLTDEIAAIEEIRQRLGR